LAFGFGSNVFDEALIASAVVRWIPSPIEHLQIALPAVVTLKFLNVEHALCVTTLGGALRHQLLLAGAAKSRAASARRVEKLVES